MRSIFSIRGAVLRILKALRLVPVFALLSFPTLLLAQSQSPSKTCQRIVSLAPSITETLFSLGLGPQVIGVTRFCSFPPEVLNIPKIGGYLDTNIEAILALNPSLVVLFPEQRELTRVYSKFGIQVLEIDHRSVAGILESFQLIGATCDSKTASHDLITNFQRRLDSVKHKIKGVIAVKVMIVVGRTDEKSGSMYVSGNDGFYNDLIALAGGINVNQSKTISLPLVTLEGVHALNPDVIVEILMGKQENPQYESQVLASWRQNHTLAAIKNERIFVISDPLAVIPGPRSVELLERIARILHPEVFG